MSKTETILMYPPTNIAIRPPEDGNYGNRKEEEFYQYFIDDSKGFRKKAVKEWKGAVDIYEAWNMNVFAGIPTPGMHDQVFSADPAFTIINPEKKQLIVLKSHFTNAARTPEIEPFMQLLKQAQEQGIIDRDLEIVEYQMLNNFEGTGDCYYDHYRDIIIAGYTTDPDPNNPAKGRSSIDAHPEVEMHTGIEVLSLEIKEPYFHIDTCLVPLPTGHMLIYKDGMTDEAYETLIKKAFIDYGLDPDEYLIEVSENDALNNFVTNLQCVGNKILMPQFGEDVPKVEQSLLNKLKDIGYDVTVHNYGHMIRVGGAMHCTSHHLATRTVGGLMNANSQNKVMEPVL